ELATGLTYRNLRRHVGDTDPALSKLLGYVGVDEQAHYSFFLKAVQLYLRFDRVGTLEQVKNVLGSFGMPAIHEMTDGIRRAKAIEAMRLFDDRIFFEHVYQPVLAELDVSRSELRRCA